MSFTVCPTAVVAAPVDSVWELLEDPTSYDAWWDARMVRIVPEGKATPGQILYANASAFGWTKEVTLQVESVDPEKHQIQILVTLLFGIINHATITATALDKASSRLQFG